MNTKDLLIDFINYCRDNHFMPILHDHIEPLADDYLHSKNDGKPIVIGSADILLLTDEVKAEVKRLWSLPHDYNSSPKVAAVKLIMKIGKDTGVELGIKKAKEVIEQHCL